MIPFELVVAWGAIVIAACYIIYQHLELRGSNEAMDQAEEALEAADKAVSMYQTILADVAHGHTTLEVMEDGRIIATHYSAEQSQVH